MADDIDFEHRNARRVVGELLRSGELRTLPSDFGNAARLICTHEAQRRLHSVNITDGNLIDNLVKAYPDHDFTGFTNEIEISSVCSGTAWKPEEFAEQLRLHGKSAPKIGEVAPPSPPPFS